MVDETPGRAVGRHWLVIETGANQAYVFASNKQGVNVGASELIWQVGHRWVEEAVRDEGPADRSIEIVVRASGKALLLVESEETGRAVTRAVTRRALAEAPGLEVWGYTDPTPIVDEHDVGPALARAHRLHASWRSRRPAGQLRHPTLPFVRRCDFSGRPATEIGREGSRPRPQAASIAKAWTARNAGRNRMAQRLSERAVVRPEQLIDGVSNAGWIAVVHADGNGIGEIFRNLPEVYAGDEFLDRLRAFSAALDEVTNDALRSAVQDQPELAGWLLPLVVGGDDVTAVLDARVAFDVTSTFLREFARRSAEHEVITEVVARVGERTAGPAGMARPAGLTACAGIAYVRPHYTFSDAYRLAEELCTSAKRVKELDPRCGALDFHVLHDSVGRGLDRIRAAARMPMVTVPPPPRRDARDGQQPAGRDSDREEFRLWAGPVVVSGDGVPVSGWAAAHHEQRMRAAMAGLRGDQDAGESPVLARSGLHQLRQALFSGVPALEQACDQVVTWAPDPARARAYLRAHLRVSESVNPPEQAPEPEPGRSRGRGQSGRRTRPVRSASAGCSARWTCSTWQRARWPRTPGSKRRPKLDTVAR